MPNDNTDNATIELLIVISLVIGIALYPYYDSINSFIHNIIAHWVYFVIYLVLIIILVLIAIFSLIASYGKIAAWLKENKERKNNVIEIEDILSSKLEFDEPNLINDIEELKQKISLCKFEKKLSHYSSALKKRLAKATEFLEELEKHKRANELEERNERLKSANAKLEEEYERKINARDNLKKSIVSMFDYKSENVFLKEDLTKEEIQALTENGYYSASQFCIIQKRYLDVIIRPCLKHSPTHIFLTWNVKKLLESIKGIENLQEHLTHDADFTFRYNGKIYALEIETGTLLEKKKQIEEKLNYLNKKYPKRWMFIVSNKNLLPKYRKLGPSASRSQVKERLSKMLEISHPF